MTQLTKEYFDQRLDQQTAKLTEQNEALARMVKTGFDSVDKNFARLADTLQVREEVNQLKVQMQEIRQALNLKH
ncbi:MAG: hypothetical protein Q8Q12_07435 [bacterium]|nr:hypothetical protein [bacterium]